MGCASKEVATNGVNSYSYRVVRRPFLLPAPDSAKLTRAVQI